MLRWIMKSRCAARATLIIGLLIPTGLVPSAVQGESSYAVGVAEVSITPPEGFPMAGYYHERLATGTHDPLMAKAIVFRDGDTRAALVVCDLTGISVDLSTEVRRRASKRTGIPVEHIIVSATHSHTAPDYARELFDYLQDEKMAESESRERYAKTLIDGIVEAVSQADSRCRPVVLACGSAIQETPVSFNRRFVMRDGSVRTWMRLDHPDVIRPAGPIDPEVGIVLVRDAGSGKPVGVLSNFALHLDTLGGTQWSADYPFYVQEVLRQSRGDELISIFATGCCGDINHVDPARADRNKTDFIGQELGRTVNRALDSVRPLESGRLRVGHRIVRVPLQPVSAEQVAAAFPVLLRARAGEKVDFFEQVAAYKTVMLDQLEHRVPQRPPRDFINWGLSHAWAGVGDSLPVEVQTLTFGNDLAIVCLPGEIFVDLGLAIKRASPFRTTLVVELSNCVETIYVPTRAAYAGGSYEVTNSALQPGGGEMLVEAALRLLRDAASAEMAAAQP